QLRLEALNRAAISARDRLPDAFTQRRIETILRYIGERGDKAVETVAAGEHAGARAIQQVQDAARDRQQLLARHLPQLFAWIVFDDLAQRLRVVPARREACLLHHPFGLVAQHRDVARRLGETLACEEANEVNFADRLPVLVVALEADRVASPPPMNARAQRRLGNHLRRWLGNETA